MTDTLVRPAERADAGAIAGLAGLLGHAISEGQVAANLDTLSEERLIQWVAEIDGAVVGLLGMDRMTPVYRPRPVARITILSVAGGFRGRGIGRLLVQRALRQAREWHCGLIEVTSNDRLADAHAFYRHLGFEQTSRRFAREV